MSNYANPEVLVSISWVEEHQNDPSAVVVDANTKAHDEGRVPSAMGWNWQT